MSGWTTQPDLRQLFNLINGKKHVIKRSWCQVKLRNLTYTNDLFQQSEKLVSKNFLMSGPRAGPDLRELLNPIIGKTYWYACVLVVRFKNGTWPTPIIWSDKRKIYSWAPVCDVRLNCATWPTPMIYSNKQKNTCSRCLWCQVQQRDLTYANYLVRQEEN